MWGSVGQLMANLAGIVLAGTLTLLLQKALWKTKRRPTPVDRRTPNASGRM